MDNNNGNFRPNIDRRNHNVDKNNQSTSSYSSSSSSNKPYNSSSKHKSASSYSSSDSSTKPCTSISQQHRASSSESFYSSGRSALPASKVSSSKKGTNNRLTITIIISIVVIIMLLFIIIMFINRNQVSDNKDDSTSSIVSEKVDNGNVTNSETNMISDEQSHNEQKSKVLDEAQSFVTSGDYKSALTLIKNAQASYGDDDDYSKMFNKFFDDYKTKAIDEAEIIAQDGDYIGAVNHLIEVLTYIDNSDSEISEKINEYETEYINETIKSAEDLVSNGKYDEALLLISEAQKKVPGNAILQSKYDDILIQSPNYLVDILQPYESNDYEMFNETDTVMMGGIERHNGFTLNVYGWNGQSCAIYNLNGKYKSLTGLIGYVDGQTGDGQTWDTYILADGKSKFSCSVSPGDLPYEFNIDLTGVKKLEFRTGGTNGYHGTIGFAEIVIIGSSSNATVSPQESDVVKTNSTHLVDILQPYESNDYEMFNETDTVMMGGIERHNGFTLNVYGWNGQSCAIYNLNGKYKSLTGLIGYVDGQTGDGQTWDTYILADGKSKFSCSVSPGDLPYEFNIDLTGVKKLEFRTGGTNGYHGTIGFAEIKIE